MRATIKPVEKGFVLMLGDIELGTSKADFDAQFHMHRINDALDKEYERGVNDGAREDC